VRKKGTQTITLPISVSLANIEATGTSVRIWKNKTVGAVSTPSAPTVTEELKDCDVKIRVV
jgi:hypothetical protein